MTDAPACAENAAEHERRRFSTTDVERWRTDGFAIIPGFFSPAEIAPIVTDYERLYGERRPSAADPMNRKVEGQIGRFNRHQFSNIDTLPYDGSITMNLLSLHPALIDFAKAALGVSDVHLYQSHTWAKFTGEADFDQPFHCDFGNHTLTVPADEPRHRSIDFIVYFTDVTDAHGALHYVTKPDACEILGDGTVFADTPEAQAALKARERSAAAPAGTLVAHGIDTFHRGTNLTLKGAHRYTMTVGYKAAGNEQIGFHVWQVAAGRNWAPILANASPEQLAALGIPRPGDAFWTPRTLALTQARWPDWDMGPWFDRAPAR
ncbi:MAG: phytanoyl-CoA dioxygenase family protein [Pseudomonadales bacterium]